MKVVLNVLISVALFVLCYVAVYFVYFTVDYFFDGSELDPAAGAAILVFMLVILTPLLYCVWAKAAPGVSRFRAAAASVGVGLGVYLGVKLLNTMLMVTSLESLSYVGTIHTLGAVAAVFLALRTARNKLRGATHTTQVQPGGQA